MAKQTCSICGEELKLTASYYKLQDGLICGKCVTRAGIPINFSTRKECAGKSVADFSDLSNEIQVQNDKENSMRNQFNTTGIIGNRFKFDDENQIMLLAPKIKIMKYTDNDFNLIRYDQIAEYELQEDGTSVSKGGLGMAAVGAATFGAAGAIVGSNVGGKKGKNICNTLKIKLTLRDSVNASYFIDIIKVQTKKSSFLYKSNYSIAQELLSKLKLITESVEPPSANVSVASGADEIRKYKELLDEGIITKEEFDVKKKELLGL